MKKKADVESIICLALHLPYKIYAFVISDVANVAGVDVKENSWNTYDFVFNTLFEKDEAIIKRTRQC